MGYHFNLEMVTQETDARILTLKHGKTTYEYREAVVIVITGRGFFKIVNQCSLQCNSSFKTHSRGKKSMGHLKLCNQRRMHYIITAKASCQMSILRTGWGYIGGARKKETKICFAASQRTERRRNLKALTLSFVFYVIPKC